MDAFDHPYHIHKYSDSETSTFLLVEPGFHKANRDLKQADTAAERWWSVSKFLFKRTQGQVNSLLIEQRFECDRLLSPAASVCLRSLFAHDNDQFLVKTKRLVGRVTAQSHNRLVVCCVVVVEFAVNGKQALTLFHLRGGGGGGETSLNFS